MARKSLTEEDRAKLEEIDELVFKFQNGNEKAGLELIDIYEPFLRKYYKLVKDGLLNFQDKDSRKFVGLFIEDADCRKKLVKNRLFSEDTTTMAHLAAGMICHLCQDISQDDIMQELITLFIVLAKRYKKKGKNLFFGGYLYSSYKYELYRRILMLTTDPLVHRADMNLEYYDESYMNDEEMVLDEPCIYTNEPVMVIDDDLGNSWVRGLTCTEAFEDLSPTERLILKLKYYDNLTDIEISQRMGLHRNTIRAHRLKAIDKIKYQLGGGRENY